MQARDTAWTQGLRAGPGYNTKAITPSTCACARVELCLQYYEGQTRLEHKNTKVCIWLRPNHHFHICVPIQMEHNEHKSVYLAEAKQPRRRLASSGEFWRALASSGELWRVLESSGELWRWKNCGCALHIYFRASY